ncbi:MAG: hypothetical protein AAFQ94_10410 [Bacteroidota bacterium]
MNVFYKSLFTVGFILSSSALIAQPPGPPATPIDGGIGLLLAGGAAYGIKKIRDMKRNNQKNM